jgi:predicted ABC-type ATPase
MGDRPTLYVIAGPNGAGKSTYSPILVPQGVVVIDFDALEMKAERLFPDLSSMEWVGMAEEGFDRAMKKALSEKSSFAFETNYRSPMVKQDILPFKEQGYPVVLHCFGLDSLEESYRRVDQRVEEGGHSVDDESLEFNFRVGPEEIKKDFGLFDQVNFIRSRDFGLEIFSVLHKGKKERFQVRDTPEWYMRDYKVHVEAQYPYKKLRDYIDLKEGSSRGKGMKKSR